MITLEDQIRRYATDVAGPALADAPADLFALGRPRHRGRWLLVAALVVFIAGLTWVATRPTELSDAPTVDTIATTPATFEPSDAVSRPGRLGPCRDTGPIGVWLAGTGGEGICIVAEQIPVGTGSDTLFASVYVSGGSGGGGGIASCFDHPVSGETWPTSVHSGSEGTVITVQVPPETATARVLDGTGPTLDAFDLPGVEGSRFLVTRVPDQSWVALLRIYDASGQPVMTGPTCPDGERAELLAS